MGSDTLRSLGRNVVTTTTQIALNGHGRLDLLDVAADAFGNALGNSIANEVRQAQADRTLRKMQGEIAEQGAGGFLADRMAKSGRYSAEEIERVRNSGAIAGLTQYAERLSGAGLSLDKLTEAEQLALLSGLPLGSEIFSRDATTIEASSPRTIDGHQVLSEIRVVPDATVLDYVAGGLNAGANAINDLVDIVGGPERAEWLVGGIQAAIYGVPKTAVDLAVGKLIEPGVSFVAGKISGVLKTDVFSYQASPESAEVLSDTLGGMTAEMVFGKARGVVSNSQGYAVAKETVLATKQAARGALDGPLGVAANRFFRDAAKNAQDFRITDIAGGGKRFEFFSPAKNPGYGKRYIQEVDNTGAIVRELKDTLGPEGLIETKWIHGGP